MQYVMTAQSFVGSGAALTGISGATESVNASMIGNGATGVPLGVSGSSVAILTGAGFVSDSQLDNTVTLLGQVIPISGGGTNATTASAARTSLGVAASGANADITSLAGTGTGLTVSAVSLFTSSTTNTSAGGELVKSSVTAGAFYGDGSHLSGISNTQKSVFFSGSNGTLGVGTFSFGYSNTSVAISSISVIILSPGSGGSSGTVWACCSGGNCVSATSSQGAAAGSSYNATGNVNVTAGNQIVLQMTSSGEVVTPTANVICAYQ